MKKFRNFIKRHKILTIVLSFFLLIIILSVVLALISSSKGAGSRCSDSKKYTISSKTQKSVESRIKEIEQVKDVDIYTKLCTIKIIISLKDDVDIEVIKTMSNDILTKFSEKELKYYDFALYVTSDNKKSETYPINVSKHKTSDSFAW